MGSCFLIHGLFRSEGGYYETASTSMASLNLIGMCFLIVPTTLHLMQIDSQSPTRSETATMSRLMALILLAFYFLYLLFRFRTHSYLFDELISETNEAELSPSSAVRSLAPLAALTWFAISLACVSICAVAVVSHIRSSIWSNHQTFFGLILLPFLGNIADYKSACAKAMKNELDIPVHVTMGSSVQIMLFTLPLLVLLGWVIGKPMTLQFQPLEIAAVFVGVYFNMMVLDGKSNYFRGTMCIALCVYLRAAKHLLNGSTDML